VMRAHRAGFHVGEAPITFRERRYGSSKISRTIVVEALWMVTRWGLQLRLGSTGLLRPADPERR
jgi:dolichol-phosphate mannosyltransferase